LNKGHKKIIKNMPTEYQTKAKGIEYKNYHAEYKVKERGIIEAYVSIFNNVDSQNERILPGAFKDSLKRKLPKGVWMHNWEKPIATTISAVEDEKGLKIVGKLILTVQQAKEAYELMKEGVIDEFSIGYKVEEDEIDKNGVRNLKKLTLYEWSPVLVGANDQTELISIKSLEEKPYPNEHSCRLEDPSKYEKFSRKNCAAKHDGKCIDFIYGIKDNKTELQAMRFDKKIWTEEEAKNYCQEKGGIFEPAGEKGVIPYKEYPTADEDTPWNGPEEVANAEIEDLKIMCAWYDSENPDVKSSYKLPHHRASDYKVVWNGVRAAMAALLGARGGVNIPESDKKGVYNHLAKHYKQFDKEVPPFKEIEEEETGKKEGRVLSAKNRAIIKKAIDVLTELYNATEPPTDQEKTLNAPQEWEKKVEPIPYSHKKLIRIRNTAKQLHRDSEVLLRIIKQ